jgi:hypothetical protein
MPSLTLERQLAQLRKKKKKNIKGEKQLEKGNDIYLI